MDGKVSAVVDVCKGTCISLSQLQDMGWVDCSAVRGDIPSRKFISFPAGIGPIISRSGKLWVEIASRTKYFPTGKVRACAGLNNDRTDRPG